MLTHLNIKNLAIVDNISLDFSNNMHVITGETGAGKSILLDALGLTLGMRASANVVGPRHTQAEVCAQFDLRDLPEVLVWLKSQDLDENDTECLIRRIVNSDGRSKSYVNGTMVTVNQLKELGSKLVNIHSQHQHHTLLNPSHQRKLLDQYATHSELVLSVQKEFEELTKHQREYQKLQEVGVQEDKLQLLNYQIAEIEALDLGSKELNVLQDEHDQLAKADDMLNKAQITQHLLSNEEGTNIIDLLHKANSHLKELYKVDSSMLSATECLQQAIINIDETNAELTDYVDSKKPDPQRLSQIEQRLTNISQTARKNRTTPENLLEHYAELCKQRDKLLNVTEQLTTLRQQIETSEKNYFQIAIKLSESRKISSTKLSKAIENQLKKLDLPNAKFDINISSQPELVSSNGIDEVVFHISTNLGQKPHPLKAIASGGELSRVSLAIQVISAEIIQPPTLVFDEVDVGISGKTAEIVGKLLNLLGNKAQVLCITHLPQVACQGKHHFKVSKHQSNNTTNTNIQLLNKTERINEIARLLGGVSITPQAIANAESMLV